MAQRISPSGSIPKRIDSRVNLKTGDLKALLTLIRVGINVEGYKVKVKLLKRNPYIPYPRWNTKTIYRVNNNHCGEGCISFYPSQYTTGVIHLYINSKCKMASKNSSVKLFGQAILCAYPYAVKFIEDKS